MMRRYLCAFWILVLSHTGVVAQDVDDPVERMNNIKLGGNYYTGEATASSVQEAEEMAKMMLQENMEGKNVKDLQSQLKRIEIKRGDMTMMFLYVAKDAVTEVSKPVVAPHVQQKEVVNYTPHTEIKHAVIEQLLQSQTYTAAETILKHAQYDNPAIKFGKPADMTNTDDCYLIMVDREWNVAGIISPKTAAGRKDMKTNQVVSSKDYLNCAVICLKLK